MRHSARAIQRGAFAQLFERDETEPRTSAGEAHHENSPTERHGGWFEEIFRKTVDEMAPTNDEGYDEVIEAVIDVKNRLVRKSGFSPHQICFGRDPPLPGSLMRDLPFVVSNFIILSDDKVRRAFDIRASARRHTIDMENIIALRMALDARPRVTIGYECGDLVGF